jgi:hypothetical protein
MSARNKTVRRPHDVSGGAIDFSVNDPLQRLIQTEADSAYRKPWHRLERGLRLNRLRAFAEEFSSTRSLKPSETATLLALLTKALDKKLLNSKTTVEYDADEEKIKEIRPLVMHQNSAGEALFQILEKRNAVTFRKRPSGPTPQGGPTQPEEKDA